MFGSTKGTKVPTETVLDYAAELRRLAITCEFGDFLDDALQDGFVVGLRNEQIQKSLLTEDGLNMARAVEIAQAKEAASRDTKNIRGTAATAVCQLSGPADHSPPQVSNLATGVGSLATTVKTVGLGKPSVTNVVNKVTLHLYVGARRNRQTSVPATR